MTYMKHKEHGNAHVPEVEVEQRQVDGWVSWPRTRDQKLNRLAAISGAATRVPPDADPEVNQEDQRANLLAEAEAKGLKIDRRWSDARIAEELAKA